MGAGRLDDDEIASINVTPLVDVVLVLLIIFMITAPALYQGAVEAKLPDSTTSGERPAGPLEVVLDRDGIIRVDGRAMTGPALSEWVVRSHRDAALILADTRVEHGKVIALMDILKTSGIRKISFGVEVAR